jgi:hypothetical protein
VEWPESARNAYRIVVEWHEKINTMRTRGVDLDGELKRYKTQH